MWNDSMNSLTALLLFHYPLAVAFPTCALLTITTAHMYPLEGNRHAWWAVRGLGAAVIPDPSSMCVQDGDCNANPTNSWRN